MGESSFDQVFGGNDEKSSDGVEHCIGINAIGEDINLIIAELGNPAYAKAGRRYAKALSKARHNEKMQSRIMSKITAESILLSWSGVLDENGEPVEPSLENRIEMLNKYEKLFVQVHEFAADPANFRGFYLPSDAKVQKDTEKNLEAS